MVLLALGIPCPHVRLLSRLFDTGLGKVWRVAADTRLTWRGGHEGHVRQSLWPGPMTVMWKLLLTAKHLQISLGILFNFF